MFHFNENTLLTGYVAAYPTPAFSAVQAQAAGQLLGYLKQDPDVSDVRWAAYMLATVKHECADTWRPIAEYGTLPYFQKYDAGTPLGTALGNTKTGDGYRFRGRGYVQLTGRANYAKMSRVLGLGTQLVDTPDMAMQPEIAFRIMSYGMRRGCFTGRKLADYLHDDCCDYRNARRIINGLDQADRIAGYAAMFEKVLRAGLVS